MLERCRAQIGNSRVKIDSMDDYLHTIWCSKHGYTKQKELAEAVADTVTTSDAVKAFARDLEAYCDDYVTVVAAASPTNKDSLNEDIRDLRRIMVQANGFLTMVHAHTNARFEEAVNIVLSLQIRNVSIGNHRANEYETLWPRWAGLARKKRTDEAFAEIRRAIDPDEEFTRSMAEVSVPSSVTARHVLRRMDPARGTIPADVDVEHVLPKSVVNKLNDGKVLSPKAKQWLQDLGYEVPETVPEKKCSVSNSKRS